MDDQKYGYGVEHKKNMFPPIVDVEKERSIVDVIKNHGINRDAKIPWVTEQQTKEPTRLYKI